MSTVRNNQNPWPKICIPNENENSNKLEFEDTFVKKAAFKPLDDSETYLASLG